MTLIKKSMVLAVILLTFATASLAKTTELNSVWGIPFGSSFSTVDSSLISRGCSILEDMTAISGGRKRVTTYRGDFFSRPCDVKVYFTSDSMVEFKLLFLKKPGPASGDVGAMFGNYTDLTLKLRSKYGYDRVKVSHNGGETQTWTVGTTEVELACDGRSSTNHTTVLTYRKTS